MQTGDHGGPIFTYPFSAGALSTGGSVDLWCVTGSTSTRYAVREIRIGQYSEAGDAQAEMLPITFFSGSTAPSSATAITGLNINRYSTAVAPQATCTVAGPSTVIASTASAALILADSFNVAGGFHYYPVPAERYILGLSQRFVVRGGSANAAVKLTGTLMLQELAKTTQ